MATVERVVARDLSSLGRAEVKRSLADVSRVAAWAEAQRAAHVRRLRDLDGDRPVIPTGKAVAGATGSSRREGEKAVRRADELADKPAVEAALEAGQIGGDHIDAMSNATRGLDADTKAALAGDGGADLVEAAVGRTPEQLEREIRRRARAMNDGDDGDVAEFERQRRANRLRWWIDPDTGMVRITGSLDPLNGQRVVARLERLVRRYMAGEAPDTAPDDPRERADHYRALALFHLANGTRADDPGTTGTTGTTGDTSAPTTPEPAGSGSTASSGGTAATGTTGSSGPDPAHPTTEPSPARHPGSDTPGTTDTTDSTGTTGSSDATGPDPAAHPAGPTTGPAHPTPGATGPTDTTGATDSTPTSSAGTTGAPTSGPGADPGRPPSGPSPARAPGGGAPDTTGTSPARPPPPSPRPAAPGTPAAAPPAPGTPGAPTDDPIDLIGGGVDLTVVIDLETIMKGLHDRSIVDAGHPAARLPIATILRLACTADIVPVVLDGHGVPIHVGRSRRLATAGQRRALRAVYPTCAIDGCTVPVALCQPHHIEWWRNGGATDLPNLLPLCSRHHHAVHEGGWHITLDPTTRALTIAHPDGTRRRQPPPRAPDPARRPRAPDTG